MNTESTPKSITLPVYVRMEDILGGTRAHPYGCPVATSIRKAFAKAFPGLTPEVPLVGMPDVAITVPIEGGTDCWFGTLPPSAQQWLAEFDAGKNVPETQFNLTLRTP